MLFKRTVDYKCIADIIYGYYNYFIGNFSCVKDGECMKYINEWTYTVCITLIFSVMFSLLLPKGSQGKVGKIVITVFIMISFILPFKANGFNFDIDEYESISNVEIDSKEETYSDLIKSNIEKTLADADYKNSKVKVTVKLKDEELYIQSADVYILDDYDSKEVKDFLFEN